jgi:hypothetical protein
VKYLPVADATKTIVALCPGIEEYSLHQMKNEHRDPDIFFQDIVAEVPHFMQLMRTTHAILVGIRAFSYFHHINIKDSHPWEFVCQRDVLCWLPFIDHLETKGVEWENMVTEELNGPIMTSFISGSMYSNGKRIVIHVRWIAEGRGAVETIVDTFGMTPLQCMISGYEAVDPYGKLHQNKMYRLWEQFRLGDQHDFPNVFEGMNMCHNMSIKPISYDMHRKYDPYTRFTERKRLFGEDDAIHILFNTKDETSNRLQISDMMWIEGAYRVEARSQYGTTWFAYSEIKSRWPWISIPRIDAEYAHHDNPLLPVHVPSWIMEDMWILFMLDLFGEW